eukprot:COSAG05_NODE_794_length_7287_cov_45.558431_3_plen_130_part_00
MSAEELEKEAEEQHKVAEARKKEAAEERKVAEARKKEAEEQHKRAEQARKKLEKEKAFNAKIGKFGQALGLAHAGIKQMGAIVFGLATTFGLQVVLSLGMVMHADTLDKNPSCAQLISVDDSVSVILFD